MLQKLFKAYPPLMSFFLSRVPPKTLEKRGQKFALKTFQQVSQKVPAYQKFLADHKVDPARIRSIDDFKGLPIMDKKNYQQKFKLPDLCLEGKLSDKYLIDSSSGYSGSPSYWPRLNQEDLDYPFYMENAYRQFYQIDQKSTLMIVTLALGSWIGGEKISWASRQIAIRGKNPLTVITPGINLDETIQIVKNLSSYYDQTVIVGYPPFVKRIIDQGEKEGIDWKKINVKLGLGGEDYSEGWREYLRKKIGLPKNDLMGIAGGYGAADLGMSVGREYPLSVLIRWLAYQDEKLARALFGQARPLPSLCQYNPTSFYIEEIKGELVFTALAGIPVVRYNIHDRGGVIPYTQVLTILSEYNYQPLQILDEYGYTQKDIWHLPFFYVWGRSDGSASLFGVIIYTENIKSALDKPEIAPKTTGNFSMATVFDEQQNPHLQIKLELASGVKTNSTLGQELATAIASTLKEENSEYNRLFQEMGTEVMPKIALYPYKDQAIFDEKRIKYCYTEST